MDLKKSQLSEEADRIDEEWSWFGFLKKLPDFYPEGVFFFCGGSWYIPKYLWDVFG